jgi:hypothetical protein
MYVKRLEDFRKKENDIIVKNKKTPGSGFLWNNKPKNFNNDYDYTQHTFSNQDFRNKNLLFKRNKKNRRDKKDLFKGMEFGKAVDVLHKKLNSFKI